MPFIFIGTLGKFIIELGKSGVASNDQKPLDEATGALKEGG